MLHRIRMAAMRSESDIRDFAQMAGLSRGPDACPMRLASLMRAVLQTREFTQIAKDISYHIRKKLLAHLQSISMAEYETLGTGAVYAVHLVRRGRSLARRVEPGRRRWMTSDQPSAGDTT